MGYDVFASIALSKRNLHSVNTVPTIQLTNYPQCEWCREYNLNDTFFISSFKFVNAQNACSIINLGLRLRAHNDFRLIIHIYIHDQQPQRFSLWVTTYLICVKFISLAFIDLNFSCVLSTVHLIVKFTIEMDHDS